jgi:hypothetical protein
MLRPLPPVRPLLRQHWFWLVALAMLATDTTVIHLSLHSSSSASPQFIEAGLLCDLALVLPCLYLVCYRREGKRAIVRSIALASVGVWAASKLLPETGHFLIKDLYPVRYAALAVIAVIELKMVVAAYKAYKAVFQGASRQASEAQLAKAGMPPWAAKLAAAEAAFWHRVYSKVKGLLGKRR